MPRYDYRCGSCGSEFELTQTFQEAGTGACPLCSGAGQRVYHAVPVIYKGSGFYTTDYGRPKAPAENDKTDTKSSSNGKSASDTDSSAESSSSSSSDSKSETSSKAASESSA